MGSPRFLPRYWKKEPTFGCFMGVWEERIKLLYQSTILDSSSVLHLEFCWVLLLYLSFKYWSASSLSLKLSSLLCKHSFNDFIYYLPGGSEVKASACNAGDVGSIPGLGRSPGEGNGNPLQYSCLENPMNGGACWATVHEVAMISSTTYV